MKLELFREGDMKKHIAFWVIFSAVLVFSGGLFVYYVVNCYRIAEMHIEPQASAAFTQLNIGIFSGLVFRRIRYFRVNQYWYVIPLLLIVFAIADYGTIVPCPICAGLS